MGDQRDMAEVLIRPTLKFIKLGYVAVLVLVLAAAWFGLIFEAPSMPWVPAVVALLMLWPVTRQIRRQSTRLIISGDKLRYEAGFLSKTTRTISLAKVQDVSVHQTIGQRMTGTGDLSIETAGESSRLTVHSIDNPQKVADEIHTASEAAARDSLPPGAPRGQVK
jgi:uncharacterized membrane protein YdbT with pleckstrin-like domain